MVYAPTQHPGRSRYYLGVLGLVIKQHGLAKSAICIGLRPVNRRERFVPLASAPP